MAQNTVSYARSNILVDSRDRRAGTPSEYYVELQPKLRNVVKLRITGFSGGAFPYTFKQDTYYYITAGFQATPAEPWTYFEVRITIPMGMYKLPELVDLLNSYFYQARIRIQYNQLDRRVHISKSQMYYDGDQYLVTAVSQEGRNTLVDTLIGFPRGWAIGPELTTYSVYSSFAVQPEFLPDTLMISFSNFPSKVTTSSGIIGVIAIPYTSRTFEWQSNRIFWTENTQYLCEVETYAEYINNLGVRITDSRTGQKYTFMEEHTIHIEVTHADVMEAKPYPVTNIHPSLLE